LLDSHICDLRRKKLKKCDEFTPASQRKLALVGKNLRIKCRSIVYSNLIHIFMERLCRKGRNVLDSDRILN